ncbi:hypothetical protein EJ04DRAFT_609413, partial [Polyplosphaeria fusca]
TAGQCGVVADKLGTWNPHECSGGLGPATEVAATKGVCVVTAQCGMARRRVTLVFRRARASRCRLRCLIGDVAYQVSALAPCSLHWSPKRLVGDRRSGYLSMFQSSFCLLASSCARKERVIGSGENARTGLSKSVGESSLVVRSELAAASEGAKAVVKPKGHAGRKGKRKPEEEQPQAAGRRRVEEPTGLVGPGHGWLGAATSTRSPDWRTRARNKRNQRTRTGASRRRGVQTPVAASRAIVFHSQPIATPDLTSYGADVSQVDWDAALAGSHAWSP